MPTCQGQETPKVPARGAARDGQSVWTELSFLGQLFPDLFDHSVIVWGIRATNLICRITDFHGNCDPRCYYALLLRHRVWKRLALLGAESCRSTCGARRSSSSRNVSQARCHPPGCLPQGSQGVLVTAMSPVHVERSTAGDREAF